jgi:sulfur transfer protein SufE
MKTIYVRKNMTMQLGDCVVPLWGEGHNLYPQQVFSTTSENKLLPEFLQILEQLPDWTEKFSFLTGYASLLAPECPESLKAFRIESCRSHTCFRADIRDGRLHVDGWSNSAVTGGVIAACMKILDDGPRLRTRLHGDRLPHP